MKRKYTHMTKEISDGVLKHYAENRSIIKASKQFDISLSAVNRILTKNGIARDGQHGSNHPSWSGGRRILDGYVLIRDPLNVMCDSRGYVSEHRLVMAKHLGRPLLRTEVVHHIDENKANNELSNLMLFSSQAKHISHHEKLRRENRAK